MTCHVARAENRDPIAGEGNRDLENGCIGKDRRHRKDVHGPAVDLSIPRWHVTDSMATGLLRYDFDVVG